MCASVCEFTRLPQNFYVSVCDLYASCMRVVCELCASVCEGMRVDARGWGWDEKGMGVGASVCRVCGGSRGVDDSEGGR